MILILTSQKGATVSKDGHLKEFGDLHRSLGWYIQGENYNSAVARFQICAADSRITLLVTRGGLGLAHPEVPSPQSPGSLLCWSWPSSTFRLISYAASRLPPGPACLQKELTWSCPPLLPSGHHLLSPVPWFVVRWVSPVLRASEVHVPPSWQVLLPVLPPVLLAAALGTVLVSCRFALILFRPGRLLCLRQNTQAAKVPECSGLPACGLQWLANQRPRKGKPQRQRQHLGNKLVWKEAG